MDPVLSSLFPVHQIGADGFNWWIGQVESNKNDDPKNSGRYRVRIVGQHLKTCDATPTEELPWANVMMPVTTPWSDGGVTGASVNLNQGNWVVGFYLDNDKQKPIIMGSVGHTAGATLLKNVEEDPTPGETCKSFTTFLSPNRDPYKHEPLPEKDKTNGSVDAAVNSATAAVKATTIGQAGLPANAVPEKHAANFYALFAENSPTNPTGAKICVEIADPKCGAESDLKGGLTNILGDMLAANQQSGGQLGDFYVSKVSGEMTRYLDVGRYHANRAIRLVKSFIARVKGELIKLIRQGVDYLVENALTVESAATDALGNVNTGPVAPNLGIEPFEPIVKKESRLKAIQEFLDNTLAELGCSIEDITDRIAQWLTDLLLGLLMDAFNAAACLVDTVVNGIINQIISFLEGLISAVMGPIQAILSLAAAPLNLIGSAINTVLGLLGISCDGPAESCQKVKKECTECDSDEKGDWLDDLISQIEDGELAGDSVCSDAKKFPKTKPTKVVAVGGVFTPAPGSTTNTPNLPGTTISAITNQLTLSTVNTITYTCEDIQVVEGNYAKFKIIRSGNTLFSSSLSYTITDLTATYNEDYTGTVVGVVGFARGERSKEIQLRTFRDKKREGIEEFQLVLRPASTPANVIPRFPKGNTFKCAITDFTNNNYAPVVGSTPSIPPQTTTVVPIQPLALLPTTVPSRPSYKITTNKGYYYNGEKIIFTILTTNVPDNTILNYEITGTVDEQDILEDFTGEITITNNTSTLEITTVDDAETLNEILTLSLVGTPAFKTVRIVADDVPTYDVVADRTVAEEGDVITYTISTANIADGTTLNYTLSGDVSKFDIVGGTLTGSFDIQNNTATVEVQLTQDGSVENSELLTFTIDDTAASADVIVLPGVETIVDPEVTTVVVSSDKLTYEEGETITYTITTSNISDGTVLQYSLFGTSITPSDISGGSLYGSFIVLDNQAKVYVGIEEDLDIERDETLTFSVNGTGAFAQVIINANEDDRVEDDPDIAVPCVTPPTFGAPITDAKGSIISIPIIERGCPYETPPTIIISGNGYGSRAIPLLDPNGYVSEVRLIKTGTNYLQNLPDSNLRCVIDSFTLLNPGRDYTSAPNVIINGKKGLAEALVNSDGYVYSVRILDRSKEYYEIPSIVIQGGGGGGARVLPNIVCKDPLELENIGYAKIGTGKYIDCP